MAGFDNDCIYGTNFDFSGQGGGQGGTATMLLDGQLLIGSTALNAGGTHCNVSTLTAGTGVSITNGAGTITIGLSGGGAAVEHITGDSGGQLNPDGSNNFNLLGQQAGIIPVMDTIGTGATLRFEDRTWPTKLVVDTSNTVGLRGTFSTLASAMASAVSGDTILLRTSVTENVTLTAGVNIVALLGAEQTPNVSITGKLTMTTAGSVTISGIRLTTSSDFFLAVTGSANSVVNLEHCYLNCLNNTGISYTSSGMSSCINILYCKGNLGTTGIGLYTATGAGTASVQSSGIYIAHSTITNTGGSSTQSTSSACTVYLDHSIMYSPVASSSAGAYILKHSDVETQNQNAVSITTAGSATNIVYHSRVASGSASGLSIGAGTILSLQSSIVLSTNANSITGAGTLNYNTVSFDTGTGVHNVTTEAVGIGSAFQKIIVQTFTATGTYTPTAGMKYCVVECQGDGGGGAGSPAPGAASIGVGGGGGGGGWGRSVFTAATIGTSQAVTIGTGGAGGTGNAAGTGGTGASLGALISSSGGSGGSNSGAAAQVWISGGAGGTSTGTVAVIGGAGGTGSGSLTGCGGGTGGQSHFGGAREAVCPGSGALNGNAGQVYGGGGGGAASGASQAAKNGGAGAAGLVVVTEYI